MLVCQKHAIVFSCLYAKNIPLSSVACVPKTYHCLQLLVCQKRSIVCILCAWPVSQLSSRPPCSRGLIAECISRSFSFFFSPHPAKLHQIPVQLCQIPPQLHQIPVHLCQLQLHEI
ncbi:unnamed protein product [Candidula unifasciata]|uniref:Uncharacterized protein n=1 Tax=Candidula unifasciata TaxID=100452 RepID=A0A8S3ZZ73_9EUPU|nr:unnamed protein product [Candidula unifasciata]